MFTPGPWMACSAANPKRKIIVATNAAGNPTIAETRSESFAPGCEPDAANAALIAEAPELLRHLKECLDCLRMYQGGSDAMFEATYRQAFDTIKRAEGRR